MNELSRSTPFNSHAEVGNTCRETTYDATVVTLTWSQNVGSVYKYNNWTKSSGISFLQNECFYQLMLVFS